VTLIWTDPATRLAVINSRELVATAGIESLGPSGFDDRPFGAQLPVNGFAEIQFVDEEDRPLECQT